MMELLASLVQDQGKVVTSKSVAYKLNIPITEACKLIETFHKAHDEDIAATWTVTSSTTVSLVENSKLPDVISRLGPESYCKAIYSVVRRGADVNMQLDALSSSVEEARLALITEDSGDRLLNNELGAVRLGSSILQAPATAPGFKEVEPPSNLPTDASIKPSSGKTAADFFRTSSLGSQGSEKNKVASKTTTAKPTTSQPKRGFFEASNNKAEVENATSKTYTGTSGSSAEPERESEKKVEKEKGTSPTKQAHLNVEFDEDDDSLSSSDSDSTSGSEDEILVEHEEQQQQGELRTASTKPAKRKKTAEKTSLGEEKKSKKVRRIVEDEEDDSPEALAKAEAKRLRREKRVAEREAEKEAMKEAKRRREIDEKEGAKHDFLLHLGAKEGSSNNAVVKKKILKTRTFLDEDGFEVTEDVMEEVEVVQDDSVKEVAVPVVATALPSKSSSSVANPNTSSSTKRGSEAKSAGATSSKSAKGSASSGKQASLTSFFSKKSKD